MHFFDSLLLSADGIKRNKTRSLLTTLGIIIGVGSVVLMVSIGASFERYLLDQLEAFGGGNIDVFPKGLEQYGKSLDSITLDDVAALERLTTIRNVAPVITVPESVRYGTEEITPFLAATNNNFYQNLGIEIARGRGLDDDDVKGARAVAVIGFKAAEDLFGTEDPLGKRLTIGARKFTVIGVAKKLGSLTGQDLDGVVAIPLPLGRAITGYSYATYVSVQAISNVELAHQDIVSLLRQRHRIENPDDDPDKDDFIARSAEQALSVVGTVTTGITAFLGLVAGISLLVGGIGIMNIMLVSVTERTREIGLRKAVGAKRRDILLQFLLEAVTLTMIGGVIGISGGVLIAFVLAAIANSFLGDFPFAVSLSAIVLSTLMALGTGLVFGIYPARRASLLSPMEALRWE